MSHCLALDGTRLSEICQDSQKKLPRMRVNLTPSDRYRCTLKWAQFVEGDL